jgi:hypothetical protein
MFDEVVEHQETGDVQKPAAFVDPPHKDRREAELLCQRLDRRAGLVVVAGYEHDTPSAILRRIAPQDAGG